MLKNTSLLILFELAPVKISTDLTILYYLDSELLHMCYPCLFCNKDRNSHVKGSPKLGQDVLLFCYLFLEEG